MEVVNKKLVLLVIVIGIVCTFFIWQNISDKEAKLEIVSLNKETKSSNMFAIMLEQIDKEGNSTYVESEYNTWPTDNTYVYDITKSGCMDANGNKIENSLEYDLINNIAKVKTEKTSYCYLYFSIPKICETGTKLGECLLNNPTLALNTNMEGGMYRYQGATADNYVCFGTNSQSDCLENTDKYLYRIIGVTENGQIKLIKEKSLTSDMWQDGGTINKTWGNNDLFKKLNGIESDTITSLFIDSETYEYMATGNVWNNKVMYVDWYYGTTTNTGNYDAESIFEIESNWSNFINAKIGLIYLSEYYYAYGTGGSPGSQDNAVEAWIHLSNNGAENVNSYEWTMAKYGLHQTGIYLMWVISSNGSVSQYNQNSTNEVRPTFFLINNVQYKMGIGTILNPFVID